MSRQLSGFKPTGHLQLGNLLGAIRPMVAGQRDHESIVLVVDLHAMTVDHDPDRLRELTVETATLLLAAGVDPARSLFYVQSQVPEHTELHYLLECVTSYGEAHRMVAVGTVLADGPPHRSRRAELPHRAPASGSGGEAVRREGMQDADSGQPPCSDPVHSGPVHPVALAAASQRLEPVQGDLVPEGRHRVGVAGHGVVRGVALQHAS